MKHLAADFHQTNDMEIEMSLPLITRHLINRVAPMLRYASERHQIQEQIRRERRSLRDLDARQLQDIGVTHEAADREARRPAWDIPESRRPTYKSTHDTPHPRPNPLLMIRLG